MTFFKNCFFLCTVSFFLDLCHSSKIVTFIKMLFCVSSATMSFFWLFLFLDPVFFWLYASFDCCFFKECVFLQWLHLFSMTTSFFKDAYFFSFFSGYVFLLIVTFFKDCVFLWTVSSSGCLFLLTVSFFLTMCFFLLCLF